MPRTLRGVALGLLLIALVAAAGAGLESAPPRTTPDLTRPTARARPARPVEAAVTLLDRLAAVRRLSAPAAKPAGPAGPAPTASPTASPTKAPTTITEPSRKESAAPLKTRTPVAKAGAGHLGQFTVSCYALRGSTASGRPTSTDVVAVDPSRIPLGSRLRIAGVGIRVAADTGGKVRGARLDIWLPSNQACVEFGIKRLAVSLV